MSCQHLFFPTYFQIFTNLYVSQNSAFYSGSNTFLADDVCFYMDIRSYILKPALLNKEHVWEALTR